MDLNLINIYDTDGRKIDMSVVGLTGLKLSIPSPSYRTVTEEIDGVSGVRVVERVLDARNLTAKFLTQAKNYDDSLKIRDKSYSILGNGRAFYVSELKNPLKRWKVYWDQWTPERFDVKTQLFEVPLLANDGHSESVNFIKKSFTSPTFRFKNDGDIAIDPRKYVETEITFKGPSTNLIIRNTTTGEEWSWTGTTESTDAISLKGVRSLKNDISIFGQTNKKLITLTPGWNNFEVIGATGDFELTIRSRFYFL